MVKVERREREQQSAAAAQQTPANEDAEQQPRKRQKHHQPQQHLSFSIESIMRGGSNISQLTTSGKQPQSISSNQNQRPQREALAEYTAARPHCGGVESPSGSHCSSVRSQGNLSQASSRCLSSSSPQLAESPVGSLNNNQDDEQDILVDQDEDGDDEIESRCDSAASRLSSPISPGTNQLDKQHEHLHSPVKPRQKASQQQEQQQEHNAHPNQQQSSASSKKSSSSSDSSTRHSHSGGGGGGASTNPLLRDRKVCEHPQLAPVECRLDNLELWHRFHPLDTEMIITKQGRRMFPPVKVNFGLSELAASSLCSRERYHVLMDVLPFDGKRYRYAYHKSSWQQAGKADPPSPPRLFLHPDGPFTLEQLRRQVISFEKIKLTNNDANKHGYIVLNSMHKYQPRIHLMLYRGKDAHCSLANAPVSQLNEETCKTFIFSETIFTAVTAYQNHSITKLKIDSNPFAKGFRDSSRLTDFELESMQDLMTDGSCPFSPPRPPPHGFSQFLLAAAAQQNPHQFAAAAAAAAAVATGPEDSTASLLRERTMMALDSIFQQQQQQQQHFHHQPTTPTSQQISHSNPSQNPNSNQNMNHSDSQQSHQMHIHAQNNKPASPPRSCASNQIIMTTSAPPSVPAATTNTSSSSGLTSVNSIPSQLVNTSCHSGPPGGAPYSFSHGQQQQQQHHHHHQLLMSSHLDQLLQLHGNPLAAAMAAAAIATQSQQNPSCNPSHSQQSQQTAPPPFGLFGNGQQQQHHPPPPPQYTTQSPPYMAPPPQQQQGQSNRNSHSPCHTPTSPPTSRNNNSLNKSRQSPQQQQQQSQKNGVMCPPMSSQLDCTNIDMAMHYGGLGAPPGVCHSQLQAAMFAAAQQQQHKMAALSLQFEREHQLAAALARHHHHQQSQIQQKGAPASIGNPGHAGSATFYQSNDATATMPGSQQNAAKSLQVNQLQQSVNSLLEQQQLNSIANQDRSRHAHATSVATPSQFK